MRLNYTNRLKIDRASVWISAKHPVDAVPFIRLEKLELPEDGITIHGGAPWLTADVWLEAWRVRTNSYFRILVGKVAELRSPGGPVFNTTLDSFENLWGATYRIKVVSTDKRILAQADNLKSDEDTPATHAELIQVYPEELGEQIWMLDWSDLDSGPRVLVNKKLSNPADFLSSNLLVTGIVLPNIIREVLKMIVSLCSRDTIGNYEWPERWLKFVQNFYVVPFDKEEKDDIRALAWVENAIAAFCVANRFYTSMESALNIHADEV
jgi:hypothetical protein